MDKAAFHGTTLVRVFRFGTCLLMVMRLDYHFPRQIFGRFFGSLAQDIVRKLETSRMSSKSHNELVRRERSNLVSVIELANKNDAIASHPQFCRFDFDFPNLF